MDEILTAPTKPFLGLVVYVGTFVGQSTPLFFGAQNAIFVCALQSIVSQ